jgi:hypothetical protein
MHTGKPREENSPDARLPEAPSRTPQFWSTIALMDYLLGDLASLSPMTAHFIRMARQNLLDERLAPQKPDSGAASGP